MKKFKIKHRIQVEFAKGEICEFDNIDEFIRMIEDRIDIYTNAAERHRLAVIDCKKQLSQAILYKKTGR